MTDIVEVRPDHAVPLIHRLKEDAKQSALPRSKRKVAAFEQPRGSSEMKRSAGALPSRMSRRRR